MAVISQGSRRSQLGVPGLMSMVLCVSAEATLYPDNGHFSGIPGLLPHFRARGGMAWVVGLSWDWKFWRCLGGGEFYISKQKTPHPHP